jgi:hypothetical protein
LNEVRAMLEKSLADGARPDARGVLRVLFVPSSAPPRGD